MSDPRTLYIGEKNISSWSLRGWLALRHKGLPFAEQTILLKEDKDRRQRRRVSPTGKVPVLHDRGLAIPDSLAIVEYLEETYPPPQYPRLWPADAAARAHARWLACAMHSGFQALRAGMSFNLCFLPQRPAAPAEALAEAREMLEFFERALTAPGRAAGPYLFGEFGAADVMYAPAVVRLTAFEVSTEGLPQARDYLQAVLAQRDVAEWLTQARRLPPAATY
jgi:glutathione S-transferase